MRVVGLIIRGFGPFLFGCYMKTWAYRANGSEIEAQLFESADEVPKGWHDSPAKVFLKSDEEPKRRGRPRKAVDNGDTESVD